jgi:hypothetical protein
MFKRLFLAIFAMTVAFAALSTEPAHAASRPDLPVLVSESQAAWTPHVDVGTWSDSLQVSQVVPYKDGIMYACGLFSGVNTVVDGRHYTVQNVFGFQTAGADKGKAAGYAPKVNGPVYDCLVTGDTLFLAGRFSSVNGKPASNIARVDLTNGQVEAFASTDGAVTDLLKAHSRLWLFGSFNHVNGFGQVGIATLNLDGTFSDYFHSNLSGTMSERAGPTKSYRGIVTNDGKYMLAIVNVATIDGKARRQVATWNLGSTHATLRDWVLKKSLESAGPNCNYMVGRGLSTVPGSPSDVVLSTTGGPNNGICDQTMRFSLAKTGMVGVKWTNYTKGDTSHAVIATTGATYTQGHMKSCALLAGGHAHTQRVYRDRNGICALNTKTGNLIKRWRSDQSRAIGGEGLTVTNGNGFPAGLWSAVDDKWGATSGIIFRALD